MIIAIGNVWVELPTYSKATKNRAVGNCPAHLHIGSLIINNQREGLQFLVYHMKNCEQG